MGHSLIRARQEDTVVIAGSVTLDGSAAVTSTTTGKGIAWAKTGTGTYTATVTVATSGGKYPKIVACAANIRSAGDKNAKVISAVASTGVFTIETTSGTAAADVASAVIELVAIVQLSNLP